MLGRKSQRQVCSSISGQSIICGCRSCVEGTQQRGRRRRSYTDITLAVMEWESESFSIVAYSRWSYSLLDPSRLDVHPSVQWAVCAIHQRQRTLLEPGSIKPWLLSSPRCSRADNSMMEQAKCMSICSYYVQDIYPAVGMSYVPPFFFLFRLYSDVVQYMYWIVLIY